jgi:broad specificity phosphatase PhoE
MLNVYLLRHGQTQWNAEGNRYCGRTDIPLTERGVRQAEAVCAQLSSISFEAIYSSPLNRAHHTAQLASGRSDVITDEKLIEVDFGQWEGKTRESFVQEAPNLWNEWNNDPEHAHAGGSGETAREVVERVNAFFSEALTRHPVGNIMVVGHNGINRLYLAHKLGMKLKDYRKIVQENSSVTMFSLDQNGELTLKILNSRAVFSEAT